MSPGNADAPSDLLARAESIAHEFDFQSEDARRLTEHFVQHMKNALRQDDSPSQIPSYVTKVPTGSEKGVFLAVDLGGTNCRVCSVRLHGDGTYALVQAKHAIPRALTADASHRPLFDFVAEKIRDFLQAHPEADVNAGDGEGDDGKSHVDPADGENDDDNNDEDDGEARPNRRRPGRRRHNNDGRPRRQLGFTFSFTYEQLALDRGRVLFWDKGWDLPSAVGKDPCELLQEAIDDLGLPVAVAALANDSVGTLLTRAYTTGGRTVTTTTKEQGGSGRPARGDGRRTLIGAIFGTGTNAAYVERARAVTRGRHDDDDAPGPDDAMVINTEWGGFGDGAPALLPTTAYDADLDAAAPHPGRELLEKRVSGLYLGELLRRALARLAAEGRLADLALPAASPLFAPAGLDSALLSHVARGGGDDDDDDAAAAHIARALGVDATAAAAVVVGPHHVRAVRCLARAVARRAARLAGAAVAAVILQSDEARRAVAAEAAPPPPLAVPPSSKAAPARPRWTTDGAASASPDGKMASLYRRFRTFVHGLMRSLGLQWVFTPPSSPPGAGGGGNADAPGPGDQQKEEDEDGVVEIGVDGSLVEFYPTFEAEMREAIRDVLGPAQERRVRIGLAKDGSGVGAALMALAASMQS